MTNPRAIQLLVRLALVVGLGAFYLAGATGHARTVNTFKARGDQTGYLSDAQDVYTNWLGQDPPILIGERNRMPLYAAYLALFYNPRQSDDEFFEIAKRWNIRLSLLLLMVLYAIFSAYLPPLPAANLTLIVGFGYFVFRAGYAQSELLFYFLFFVAFLLASALLVRPDTPPSSRRIVWTAAGAGLFAALAHLTKAAMLPLVGIFLAASAVDAFVRFRAQPPTVRPRLGATLICGAVFLAVLSPYLTTSKRVFGQYFYNVNTTFYMWYDGWPEASAGTYLHGDGLGWPDMPADQIPSMSRYWREHTADQMLERVIGGFRDMAIRSYQTFWYMKYVALYLLFAVAVIAANRRAFIRMIRDNAALAFFMLLYATVYLAGIAFYHPISGTGTSRFLLAHIAPLMFVLSCFFVRAPFAQTEWQPAGVRLTPAHFHLLFSITIGADLIFTIWPRLMTTYGGF